MARQAQQVDHPLHVQQPHRQSQSNCSLPITNGLTSCFPGRFHWAGSARSFGACGSYSFLSGCGMTCGELYRPQPSAAPQLTRVMPASPKLLCKCWPVICISRDVTQLPLCDILLSRGLDISLVIIHSFSARFGGLNFHDQFSWIYCSP